MVLDGGITITGGGSIVYGKTATISGSVAPDPAMWDGGMVKLWKIGASGQLVQVATTFFGGDNDTSYSFTVSPGKNTTYYAQFMGNDMYDSVVSSSSVEVLVMWQITTKSNKSSVAVNSKINLTGEVNPRYSGPVQVWQKAPGGSWVMKWTVTAANGVWSKSGIKLSKKGTYYFKSDAPDTATNKANTSAQIKVTVK